MAAHAVRRHAGGLREPRGIPNSSRSFPRWDNTRFAKVKGDLKGISKVFSESKVYLGPLVNFVPVSIRGESRPEISGQRTIQWENCVAPVPGAESGDSRGVNIETQFTVVDTVPDVDLQDLLKNQAASVIQNMARDNSIKVRDDLESQRLYDARPLTAGRPLSTSCGARRGVARLDRGEVM
jgi:hypothetical protein